MSSAGYNAYGRPNPPQPNPPYPPLPNGMPPHGRRGLSPLAWLLIIAGGIVFLACAGFLGFSAYIGSVGPGTQVYTGNELPRKFADVVNDLKLLDSGESIQFFYSDALTDVRNGMYFVTDRKVVVYKSDAATPATVVPFSRIADADLESSDSWVEDGSITLRLTDGSVVIFPVSGEGKRDKLLFEAIRFTPGGGVTRQGETTDIER